MEKLYMNKRKRKNFDSACLKNILNSLVLWLTTEEVKWQKRKRREEKEEDEEDEN